MRRQFWALLAALWALRGCAVFTSEAPMFPPETGIAIYGEAPVRLKATRADDKDALLSRTTFASGVYRHQVRGPRDSESGRIDESFHPFPDPAPAPGFFIAQRQVYAEELTGPPPYVYGLVRVESAKRVQDYEVSCRGLTPEERVALNMVPDAAAGEKPRSDCQVRSAAELAAAFRLLAARNPEPPVTISARPGRGLFR